MPSSFVPWKATLLYPLKRSKTSWRNHKSQLPNIAWLEVSSHLLSKRMLSWGNQPHCLKQRNRKRWCRTCAIPNIARTLTDLQRFVRLRLDPLDNDREPHTRHPALPQLHRKRRASTLSWCARDHEEKNEYKLLFSHKYFLSSLPPMTPTPKCGRNARPDGFLKF